MSASLMDLVQRLVEIESQDAAKFDYIAGVWTGSDEARAARAAVVQRISDVADLIDVSRQSLRVVAHGSVLNDLSMAIVGLMGADE